ncbi:MAG: hypothetical protein JSR93_11075, partial [Verrucomicrobia bacterium]|nr:hypothetical protein [Verrucomicrobiota bacterium]
MACNPLDRMGISEIPQAQGLSIVSSSNARVPQGIAAAPDTIASADSSSSYIGHSELSHFRAGIMSSSSMIVSPEIPKELYQDLNVNFAKIAETPQPLDPALIQHIADNAYPRIQIDELLTQFDRICDLVGVANGQVLYQDQGMEITREAARHSLENNYLGFVRNNINSATHYYLNIAADVELALKGIIFSLRLPEDGSPETPDMIAKKKTAIEDLCSASVLSVPRRHTEAFKVYRVLSNQMETLDEIVKQYIQQTKEDLFINYYSLSNQSVHTLNFIRRAVGNEFGLDTSPSNLLDPYIDMGGNTACSPENPHAPHTK